MQKAEFQDWLDTVTQTIFDGEFDLYCQYIALPFTLITADATMTIEDRDGLKQGYDSYREMFAAQGVTHMIRTPTEVNALEFGLVSGTYETRILRDATPVVAPFTSTMVLRKDEDRWRSVLVTNSWKNAKWPVALPRVLREIIGGKAERPGRLN